MGTLFKIVWGFKMKNAHYLCLLLSLLLIGCSNNNTTEQSVTAESKSNSTNSTNKIPSYYQDYILSPQSSVNR